MNKKVKPVAEEKVSLHPRNKHRLRYDFAELIHCCPELAGYVHVNAYGSETINFSDHNAVKLLNRALLCVFYNIRDWDIPDSYLCPPIPGRADYIHYAADLLASCNNGIIPQGKHIRILDIGTGANCVYPLIGHSEYGWSFVGTDIDRQAVFSAKRILNANPPIADDIECRLQDSPSKIFSGIVKTDEVFDLSMCNPPFHASAKEAAESNIRKVKNLGLNKSNGSQLNFQGQHSELWCDGGEAEFVHTLIKESALISQQCFWFTTLISKKENLVAVYRMLKKAEVIEHRTIKMAQGQKNSRFVAWTFLNKQRQADWKWRWD